MTNHTPGPWKRGDCDSWIIWAPAYVSTDWKQGDPGPEAVAVAYLEVPAWSKVDCPEEVREAWLAEADATANLIASAPDLLEALKTAKKTLRAWHGPNAWEIYDRSSPEMQVINSAIAKAEGGK